MQGRRYYIAHNETPLLKEIEMKNITEKFEKLSLRIDLAKAALKGQTIELQNDGSYAIIINRKSQIA